MLEFSLVSLKKWGNFWNQHWAYDWSLLNFDQMVILKVTSFFNGYKSHIWGTSRITLLIAIIQILKSTNNKTPTQKKKKKKIGGIEILMNLKITVKVFKFLRGHNLNGFPSNIM